MSWSTRRSAFLSVLGGMVVAAGGRGDARAIAPAHQSLPEFSAYATPDATSQPLTVTQAGPLSPQAKTLDGAMEEGRRFYGMGRFVAARQVWRQAAEGFFWVIFEEGGGGGGWVGRGRRRRTRGDFD